MNRLNKAIHIQPTFAWTDWELYEAAASTNAARVLNDTLRSLVNAGCTREQVSEAMLQVMESQNFAEVGASDTEPRAFLERVLTEIFGE